MSTGAFPSRLWFDCLRSWLLNVIVGSLVFIHCLDSSAIVMVLRLKRLWLSHLARRVYVTLGSIAIVGKRIRKGAVEKSEAPARPNSLAHSKRLIRCCKAASRSVEGTYSPGNIVDVACEGYLTAAQKWSVARLVLILCPVIFFEWPYCHMTASSMQRDVWPAFG